MILVIPARGARVLAVMHHLFPTHSAKSNAHGSAEPVDGLSAFDDNSRQTFRDGCTGNPG